MTDNPQALREPTAAEKWLDRALGESPVAAAVRRAAELTAACPATPITTAEEAAERRAAFHNLTDAIRQTEAAIKPIRDRLNEYRALLTVRMKTILAEPEDRRILVARLLGEWDVAEQARVERERAEAVAQAARETTAKTTAEAVRTMAAASSSVAAPAPTGTRRRWIVTIADEQQTRRELMALPDGHLLRQALHLHAPTLRKLLGGQAGDEIVTSAGLTGITIEQQAQAVRQRD